MTRGSPLKAGALTLGVSLIAGPSLAQVLPEQTLPGFNQSPTAPQPREVEPFVLPPRAQPQGSTGSSPDAGAAFHLNDIQVSDTGAPGARPLLSDDQIAHIVAPYRNRRVTLGEISILRDQLTQAIIARGYITSGAEIENLDATSGVLKIRLVHGRLEDVFAESYGYLSSDYVKTRFRAGAGRTLSAADLKNDYQLLLEDRHIAALNAVLRPGARPGEAVLAIENLTLKPRREMSLFAASDRSPSVGGERGGLRGRAASILVTGDELSGELAASRGLSEARINYALPLRTSNLQLNFFVQGSTADILDEPLNALDATSSTLYYGAGLSVPLRRKPGRSLLLNASVDRLKIETELLGLPFSFSPGAVEGVTEYSALRTHLIYSAYSRRRSVMAGLSMTNGLWAQAGTRDVDVHFAKYNAIAEIVQVTTVTDQRLIVRGQAQYSDDGLFTTEMLAIGGSDTVRGFRQNSLIGPKGYNLSLEYQIPASDLIRGGFSREHFLSPQRLRLGVFIDTGRVKSSAGASGVIRQDLSSAGLRLAWTPTERLMVGVHAARRLNRPVARGSYQDDGLGFKISYRF